jgi:hypothetical protein
MSDPLRFESKVDRLLKMTPDEEDESGGDAPGVIFYDADDPAEPERTMREYEPTEGPGVPFFMPEEQDEAELRVESGYAEDAQGNPPETPPRPA